MVRHKSAGKFREARKSVGHALDNSQRRSRRSEAGKKSWKNRSGRFVRPIGKEAGQPNAEYAAREPTLRSSCDCRFTHRMKNECGWTERFASTTFACRCRIAPMRAVIQRVRPRKCER